MTGLPQFRASWLWVLLFGSCILNAAAPQWPVPGKAFSEGKPYSSFVQPTAAGTPESALFGCTRNNGRRFHEAIDIAPVLERRKGEATDPVTAVFDGLVMHISRVAGNSSYGRYVVIEHPGIEPAMYTLYAHLASVVDSLAIGDRIEAGDLIGIMGRSAGGYSIPRSRAHLHLETGLRLSDDFEGWYQRQRFSSKNQHGDYNGMNLVGWDPLDFFEAFRDGRVGSVLEYVEQIPPAVALHIRSRRYPDFLERYPQLKLSGVSGTERKGWQVLLSAWGLPLSLEALPEEALRGVSNPGDISVVAVNRNELERFACRRIVFEENGTWSIGRGGRQVLELLFKPD
ncbi:M23 family metallopeptidase [Puniceicoccales bacterium CK1056]|uniref:M23 family metallopeptidase n=1 Tax=Oceanipulchritudo coccoides TaxID=2706888 RepID=A0A6B2LYN6_9BACT|nr:M23 family metallopeptidase [Oceanipulchritudo coccoides]NDV61044.1 M23 family metallopeptidase [Oceanipulchritudo coccoides]